MNASILFLFNDPATTEIYTLSLHDALPIFFRKARQGRRPPSGGGQGLQQWHGGASLRRAKIAASQDRKSTRLNSSHSQISYAVFCLKKKKKHIEHQHDAHEHHALLAINNNH